MSIWTISAQPGTPGLEVAAELAARTDVGYARHELVERSRAAKAIDHDDHAQRAWVRMLNRLDVEDPGLYSLVVDASRFPVDRILELLLAAAGTPRPAAAGV